MTALVEGIAKDKNGNIITTGIATTFSVFNKDNHSIMLGEITSNLDNGQWSVNLPLNDAGDKVLTMYSFGGDFGDDTDIAGAKFMVAIATSQFNDAPVNGISYNSDSYSGLTYDGGKFKYVNGETTTFKIGDIIIGVIAMTDQESITLIDLVTGATDETDQTVINIGRFLQTCHTDGAVNLSNSDFIEISSTTRTNCIAETILFDTDESTFESDTSLATIIASFEDARTLQVKGIAQQHIKQGIIGWSKYTGSSKPPTAPALYENGFYISSNNTLNVTLELTDFVPSGIRLYWLGSAQVTNIVLKNDSDVTVLEATGIYNSGDIIPLIINDDTGEITNIIIIFDTLSSYIHYFEFYGNIHSSENTEYGNGYIVGGIQGHIDGYAETASDDSTTGTDDYISGYEYGYSIEYTQGGVDLLSYNNGYIAGDIQGDTDGLASVEFDDVTTGNSYYISGYAIGYAIGYANAQSSSQSMIIDNQQMII